MRKVFVVGSPRSGTTWMQLLLAQHPGVVTAQETHLIDRYVGKLWQGWASETDPDIKREIGISDLMSREDLVEICRDVADRILGKIAARRADAEVLIEKTPGHVLHSTLIRELYPDALFVHVVRDPRAVVASMRRASQGWGSWWAPRGILACTDVWYEHVAAGLEAERDTDGWRLVNYESLNRDCVETVAGVLDFLGLDWDEPFLQHACHACHLDQLKEGNAPASLPWDLDSEPEGFFGPGKAESWREELSDGQIRVIESVTVDLMDRLGYHHSHRNRFRPPVLLLRGTLVRLRNLVDRVLTKAISRL